MYREPWHVLRSTAASYCSAFHLLTRKQQRHQLTALSTFGNSFCELLIALGWQRIGFSGWLTSSYNRLTDASDSSPSKMWVHAVRRQRIKPASDNDIVHCVGVGKVMTRRRRVTERDVRRMREPGGETAVHWALGDARIKTCSLRNGHKK
jgi:hypothetical protein